MRNDINALIEPVKKRERFSDNVLEQLKILLQSGYLRSGDKLPAERELSQMFKVGRSSIREAVRTLCILGFLEIRQGDGTYVRNPQPSEYYRLLQEVLKIKDQRRLGI